MSGGLPNVGYGWLLVDEGGGAMVCLHAAPQSQLSVVASNG